MVCANLAAEKPVRAMLALEEAAMHFRPLGFLFCLAAAACGSSDTTTSSIAADGAAGTGGAGGDVGCGECFRAVRCVAACGQTPVTVGCCGCAAPLFDDLACNGDATADATADGAKTDGAKTDSSGPTDCGECFRAVTCVTACGGTPVSVGCCACVAPAFDALDCPRDAATDG
jgi:hypothetical protein